jgi:hypothetical protein
MERFRMKWSSVGLLILSAGLFSARADDLNLENQDGAVSSEAAQPDGQFGPAGDAFAQQQSGGGASQSGSGYKFHFGVSAKVSILLGIGIDGAVEVTPKSNVRGGFNFFSYDLTETQSGFSVNGHLRLRSAEAIYDWYPFGKVFHLSPGALIYNGNKVTANLTTNSGTSFTLNGTNYTSGAGNPVTGLANVALNNYKVAPMFLLGFGNLIPRSGRHFAVNFDIGAAFTGSPKVTMTMAGTACNDARVCVNAATDPAFQSNLQATLKKANNDVSFLKAFPVISIGFGYSY